MRTGTGPGAPRALVVLVVGISLGTAACGGNDQGADPPGSTPTRTAAAATGGSSRRGVPSIVPVQTVHVQRGAIARSVTVSGIVEPIRLIKVNSQLAGALLSVKVEEGDMVRRGDLLAQLDDREIQAQLAAAEANLEVAKASFQRAQQLRDRKVITLPEFEKERTNLAAANASVDQLRTRLGYTQVTAPIAGVITEKRVEQGDAVGNQTQLFTLADISTLVVRVGVSELDVGDLGVGDAVDIALDAQPGQELHGRIRRVFPTGDPTTRLVTVEVALDAASARLARPGFLARNTFALGTRSGVLLVPASALIGAAGSQAVFVVEDGRAQRRTVETGLISRGRVEIINGLQEGEEVITVGNNLLRDGMEVRIINETGGPDSAPAARPATASEGS